MFLDPSTTGLIVIGAHSFTNSHEHDRALFKTGVDNIIDYFSSNKIGFGIAGRNILNLFDYPGTPNDYRIAIDDFTSGSLFSDIFIYICSHGFSYHGNLYVMVADSVVSDGLDHQIETSINVRTIADLAKKNNNGGSRVYVIIDTCYSGCVHEVRSSLDAALVETLTDANTVDIPRSGVAFLTANHKNNVGIVMSDDSTSDLDGPAFTHVLLDILRNGLKEGDEDERPTPYGLTIRDICVAISQKLPELFKRINYDNTHGGNRPQYSDFTDYEARKTFKLVDLAVFPNNIARHDLILHAARRVRLAYQLEQDQRIKIKRQNNEIKELRKKLDELKADVSNTLSSLRFSQEETKKISNELIEVKENLSSSLGKLSVVRIVAICEALVILTSLSVFATFLIMQYRK